MPGPSTDAGLQDGTHTFLFQCPVTGDRVQGVTTGEPAPAADVFEAVVCPACSRVHFVNPRTGKVAGYSDD